MRSSANNVALVTVPFPRLLASAACAASTMGEWLCPFQLIIYHCRGTRMPAHCVTVAALEGNVA